MKKWYRYLAAGVLVLLTLCVAGCGGVSHKSPEKVTEELIQSYTDGKEKKVKECYNQADNTEADLQTEITATLKYFAAHNPKKVSVQDCEILSENDKYSYVYITYNLILEDDQEYPCVETYMVGKQDKTYYIMALHAQEKKGLHMTVMLLSWKDLQKLQTNCGASSRHFRKKNVPKAEFLIWRQR